MRVAILGTAPSSRALAPFDNPDWEIWACSPSNSTDGTLPRVTRWFELHALSDLRQERWKSWVKPYVDALNAKSCSVYMQEKNELVPKAEVFPVDVLTKTYGRRFFTSSIAWMIAFALHEGATEIGIYGVDMCAASEYEFERPGCQYFIDLARTLGVTVTIPPQSDLGGPTPLYGFGDANPIVIRLKEHAHVLRGRIATAKQRIAQIEGEKVHLTGEINHLEGALEENIYVRRTWFAWSGPDS